MEQKHKNGTFASSLSTTVCPNTLSQVMKHKFLIQCNAGNNNYTPGLIWNPSQIALHISTLCSKIGKTVFAEEEQNNISFFEIFKINLKNTFKIKFIL